MRMLIEADQLCPRFMGKTLTVNHEGNQLKGTLTNLRVDAHPWEVKTVLDIITGYEQTHRSHVEWKPDHPPARY